MSLRGAWRPSDLSDAAMSLPVVFLALLGAATGATDLRNLSVQAVTWNVNKKLPSGDISPLLEFTRHPDLVAVGLQEVTPDTLDTWVKRIDELILPNGFTKIRTVCMTGISLSVYADARLIPGIGSVTTDKVRAGLAYPAGHKGGVMISFTACGRRITLVNAHLTHAEVNLEQRVEDFHVVETRRASSNSQEDYIFWMGDLNFRLLDQEHLTAEKINEMIDKGQIDEILKMDELNNLKQRGRVFSGYQEMKINFKPTYRYYVGTSTYDLARRPAWTDRVLYRAAPGREITPLHYGSITSLTLSDHKPVEACFLISTAYKI